MWKWITVWKYSYSWSSPWKFFYRKLFHLQINGYQFTCMNIPLSLNRPLNRNCYQTKRIEESSARHIDTFNRTLHCCFILRRRWRQIHIPIYYQNCVDKINDLFHFCFGVKSGNFSIFMNKMNLLTVQKFNKSTHLATR